MIFAAKQCKNHDKTGYEKRVAVPPIFLWSIAEQKYKGVRGWGCQKNEIKCSLPTPPPLQPAKATALPLVIFLRYAPENDRGKEPAQVKRLKFKVERKM